MTTILAYFSMWSI